MVADDELLPLVQAERDELRQALLAAYRMLLERDQIEARQRAGWDSVARTVSKMLGTMHDEAHRPD